MNKEIHTTNMNIVYDIGDKNIDQLYSFLNDNYIKDADKFYKLHYSKSVLSYFLNNCILLFIKIDNQIIGSICAKKVILSIDNKCFNSCEINFLCVHKEYRQERYTKILIQQIENIINKEWFDVSISNYTIDNNINVSMTKYNSKHHYFRPLNISTLQEFGIIDKKYDTGYLQDYYSYFDLKKCYVNDNFKYKITISNQTEIVNENSNYSLYLKVKNKYDSTFTIQKLHKFYTDTSANKFKIFRMYSLEDFQILCNNDDFVYRFIELEGDIISWACFCTITIVNQFGSNYKSLYLYNIVSLIDIESTLDYIIKDIHKNNYDTYSMVVIPDIFTKIPDSKYIKSDTMINYYFKHLEYQQCQPFENALCTI